MSPPPPTTQILHAKDAQNKQDAKMGAAKPCFTHKCKQRWRFKERGEDPVQTQGHISTSREPDEKVICIYDERTEQPRKLS